VLVEVVAGKIKGRMEKEEFVEGGEGGGGGDLAGGPERRGGME